MNKIIVPRVTVLGVPIHAMLVPFPIACIVGAMLTDIVYSQTAVVQWSNFSAWFLAFALVFGVLAAVFGLIDFLKQPSSSRPAIGWIHLAGNIVILILALVNSFIHARDGWTAVVPTGLTLSVVSVLVLIVTGFLGHRMAYHHVRRDEP